MRPASQCPSSFPASSQRAAASRSGADARARWFALAILGAVLPLWSGPASAQAMPPLEVAAAPAVAPGLSPIVEEAARRFGIPAAWIRAVMLAESFGDVRATSPKGAMGLMQIMPETWALLRRRYGLGANPYDAHDNIIAGAAYLRELHDRYGIPGFLAAYNAGPARWEDHVATGRPLSAETRAYLIRLAPIIGGHAEDDTTILAAVVKSWTEAALFPPHRNDAPSAQTPASGANPKPQSDDAPVRDWTGLAPQSDGLFVSLSASRRPQ
ncbi:transglycosylase [Aliidongia dinghuensis]|uniref:Transglycosylase n=1 Tax=Aliidongia dinghuensis TaxID=1867774 RepID=A0A8J3E2K4_9PROT|nr:lytic transglycosylase domain-containing protein [Aliidongia dinghuensis]GGF11660.1 transglycosylase [Aliidongia dinghuensis]